MAGTRFAAAFGDVQLAGWDWAGASSEYERALSLEPGSERALESRARLLTYAGRFDLAFGIWNELRDMMLDTLRADSRFEPLASRVRGNRDAVVAALYR